MVSGDAACEFGILTALDEAALVDTVRRGRCVSSPEMPLAIPTPVQMMAPSTWPAASRRERRSTMRCALALVASLALPVALSAQSIPISEFADRRAAVLVELADGLLLVHAHSTPKDMTQPGWIQDASFLYFTGLVNHPEAILVLDGPRQQARLFVPPPPLSFGVPVEGLVLEPGETSAQANGFDAVEGWDRLLPYLRDRERAGVRRFYVDEARRPEALGVPEGFWPVAGDKTLWQRSLAGAFPEVEIVSAAGVIRALRWVKSSAEIALLRYNARATAAALLAGVRAIGPDVSQRTAEAAVVTGCIEAGAEGPSFWPWLMAGENAQVGRLVRAFYDYHHLNRRMQTGELVRVDIGCTANAYGGDVGRTVPVSGVFTETQRRVWDLLVAGYRAGLTAMRAGVTRAEVSEASRSAIARLARDDAETQAIAERMLDRQSGVVWHLHGVGIESGEEALERLEAGTVLAFEPMYSEGGHAYYLEDMILVTETGHEVLSTGLPYTADEIEAVMARD